MMESEIDEIAAGTYPVSTFESEIAPSADYTFNQCVIIGEEPPHTRLWRIFPLIRMAFRRIVAPERLGWIKSGHYEADFIDTPGRRPMCSLRSTGS